MKGRALIVGGGPAGASAALGLLRAGRAVTLIEQRDRWSGRVCGAFMDSEAVRHLRWFGLFEEIRAAGALRIPSSVLTSTRGAVVRLNTEQRGDASWGLPRQKLEEILLRSAGERGADVRMGTRMVSHSAEGGRWVIEARDINGPLRFEAEHLVLADGRFTQASPPVNKRRAGWFGWNASFTDAAQEPGEMSMHFYRGGYVGVLTFHDGTTNVCGLRHERPGRHAGWDRVFQDAMSRQPGLREILSGARRATEWRGVGPLPFGRRDLSGGGPILAGDAAAVGDPFMGEGIGRALGAGPMIFQALREAGDNASGEDLRREYARLWRRSYSTRFRLGFWIRRLLGPLPLFAPVMEVLLRKPAMLQALMPALHRGFPPRPADE